MRENEEPVAGFLESLRIRGRHPDTIAAYGRKLRHFTGYLSARGQSVLTIGATTLREYFMAVKEEGHAASTVWSKRHAVYALYEYLRENAFLLLNPCPEVVCESEIRLPRPVPGWRSLREVYNRLKNSPHCWEQRDYAIVDLAYSCGLRRGELHGLNVGDIEQLDGTIRVKGKGGKERVVPVGPVALRELRYYLYHVRPQFFKDGGTTKALFVSWQGGGRRMNVRSINRAFGRLRKKYGFGRSFAPHMLRHAFAADLVRNGAPVQDVAEMLGHKKLETTQIYTRLVPMDLKRCHRKYHPRG